MRGRVSFFFELYPNAFKAQETESGSAWATNKKRANDKMLNFWRRGF